MPSTNMPGRTIAARSKRRAPKPHARTRSAHKDNTGLAPVPRLTAKGILAAIATTCNAPVRTCSGRATAGEKAPLLPTRTRATRTNRAHKTRNTLQATLRTGRARRVRLVSTSRRQLTGSAIAWTPRRQQRQRQRLAQQLLSPQQPQLPQQPGLPPRLPQQPPPA